MPYDKFHFAGMHFAWWIVWIILFFIIFATPYTFPGEKTKKNTALDILKRRLALGQINNEEYLEKKSILEG